MSARPVSRALFVLLLTLIATTAIGAPATALRVTLPETVILDQLFDFTVEAIDSTGTVDPAYTGTVAFGSLNDGPVLPPNYTFTAGDAGVHVFSTKMRLYGNSRDIRVVDLSNPSIMGSDTTDVRSAPGPTQRFVIAAPATANLGEPFNFTVTAADDDGIPTGEYTGTVTFDNTGLSNPANYTFTPADGGAKTFTATPSNGGAVRIRVRDADYPLLSEETGMVIRCPGFTVTASNSGPSCFEESPTLTASTSETGVTFHWFGPIGWSADGQVVTGIPRFQGSYHVRMTHPNGCTTVATTQARLSDVSPEVEPADIPLDYLCDTMQKTYSIVDSATNGPYTNLSWSVSGHGSIVSGQGTTSATVAADFDENGGAYQPIFLDVSGTNGDGCPFHVTAAAFTVKPRPVVTIDTPAAGCSAAKRTARAVFTSPMPVETVTHLQWSIQNGTITNHIPPDIRYTVSGGADAVITLTATTDFCSYTTVKTVSSTGGSIITQQPKNTAVARGSRATLTVDVEPDATAIQWYQGLPGDRSQPVDGGTSLALLTPPITQSTTFWVEIETSCGTVLSNSASVAVEGRRRSVRHP